MWLHQVVFCTNSQYVFANKMSTLQVTWFFVEHLDCIVEVEIPEVPLAAGEAELSAGHLHVSLCPVSGVCTNGSPSTQLQNLERFNNPY